MPIALGRGSRMNWQQLVKLGLELPEVAEDLWYRTPALKVRGKGFCRLKENGEDVVFFTEHVDESRFLCASQPDIYFITDHYEGLPLVLARLGRLKISEARLRLHCAWQVKAPKPLRERVQHAANADARKPARATSTKRWRPSRTNG
jgi:hypothetical protein